ncbi:MAG: TIGR01620 family protein, partial [Rhizobiales bacterium]|nr:TIGR01620 family protein [Hyphomicrobiales bacterium]
VVAEPGADTEATRPRSRQHAIVNPEPEISAVPVVVPAEPRGKRRFPWGTLFWSALGGLVSMGFGLALTKLIEDLFARATWLGWFGAVLAALVAVALLVVIAREVMGLARLATIENLRVRAAEAIELDDRDAARRLVRDLLTFAGSAPRLARGRAALASHEHAIIDGADLIRLAERELMPPLDAEARRLVSRAAQQVSVVTAVSPRALVDMAFVLFTALRLIRTLAELYGGRPGTLGLIRLVRLVIAHLAFTGGMSAGDSIVQQMLGHGVAAKLSARLGEGVLNGLLTARLGLAAIEVARPLPFAALPPPSISDLAGNLIRRADGRKNEPSPVG